MKELTQEIIEELIKKDPEESDTAYRAFLFWSMLPARDRVTPEGIARTATEFGREESTITAFRVQNNWDERANLLDAHFYKTLFNQRLALMDESNQKFASDTKEIQERSVSIAKKVLNVVEHLVEKAALANEVQETDYVKVWQPDGTWISKPTTTIIKMDAKISDIAPLLKAAVETPMKAIGLPTEVIRPEVVDKPSSTETMTDEELALQRERIAKKKAKILGGNDLVN